MTRAEADAEVRRRNDEASGPGLWAAQRDGDSEDWRVVHLVGGGLQRTKPTGAHVESKPKPPEPADPRPAIFQNVPPYGGA
jgi:hypothetical protein